MYTTARPAPENCSPRLYTQSLIAPVAKRSLECCCSDLKRPLKWLAVFASAAGSKGASRLDIFFETLTLKSLVEPAQSRRASPTRAVCCVLCAVCCVLCAVCCVLCAG
ncbi:unnamed protein product [Ectocarpus sp. 6 AP-2014]